MLSPVQMVVDINDAVAAAAAEISMNIALSRMASPSVPTANNTQVPASVLMPPHTEDAPAECETYEGVMTEQQIDQLSRSDKKCSYLILSHLILSYLQL